MTKKLSTKFKAAYKSLTVWALSLGLVITETLPYVVDALPALQEAFDNDTYQAIVRVTLIAGIILRVRTVNGGRDD